MSASTLFTAQNTPAFGAIKLEDIRPAFDEAVEKARAAIAVLRNSNEAPSFENTVKPLDTLFSDVDRVFKVLATYFQNQRNAGVSELLAELQEGYDVFSKELYQDSVIAARFKTVYDARDTLGLDAQDLWFLESEYSSFESSGSVLDAAGQARLQEIDSALIQHAKIFNDNLKAAQKQQSFLVTDADELAGVPEDIISAMRQQAKANGQIQGWRFVPERLLVDGLLEVAENREFRRKILSALDSMGKVPPYDNRPVIEAMQRLRYERSSLLGYKSYAHDALSGTMAGDVERVRSLFDVTLAAAIPAFEKDMKHLQNWVSQKGGPVMEPWDVSYYAALYKKEELNFDAAAFSQYLELENVVQGWLQHAEKSMNVEFKETKDYPVWHEDVRVYETLDRDSGKKGLFYFDLYARPDTKEGGAWMDCLQTGDEVKGQPNIISFNMNLMKPENGTPALLSIDQLETFYHEGGHCLNGIKGTETKYRSRNGTANSSDFVEIHSMIDENWSTHPDVLATYAFHCKTGEMIPQSLLDARAASDNFMASAGLLRMVQNARRDLFFHAATPAEYGSDIAIEAQAALPSRYSDHVRPYPLTRFGHMFSDGLSQYASGYYGYFFSDMAQAAAFELFEKQGVYEPVLSERKRAFYAAGGGLEPNEAYEAFTGFPAGNPIPLLQKKGMDVAPEPGP